MLLLDLEWAVLWVESSLLISLLTCSHGCSCEVGMCTIPPPLCKKQYFCFTQSDVWNLQWLHWCQVFSWLENSPTVGNIFFTSSGKLFHDDRSAAAEKLQGPKLTVLVLDVGMPCSCAEWLNKWAAFSLIGLQQLCCRDAACLVVDKWLDCSAVQGLESLIMMIPLLTLSCHFLYCRAIDVLVMPSTAF